MKRFFKQDVEISRDLTVDRDLILGTGPAVRIIEDVLTDNDISLPTSGAVLDAISSGAATITYTNATPMPEELGGYPIGTTFNNVLLQNMLTGLLYPYQYPGFTSFAMSGQPTTLECGVEIAAGTKTWNWGTSNPSNIETDSVDVDDITTPEGIIADTTNDGTEDGAISSAITKTTTNTPHVFRISAQNSKAETFQRDFTVRWYSPFYYGVGAVGLTVAQLQALTKQVVATGNKTYSFSPTNQVMYIAYPASYGVLSSILDPNGFETIADWTLRVEDFTNNSPDYEGVTVSYNIYEFNNPTTQVGFNNTFIF